MSISEPVSQDAGGAHKQLPAQSQSTQPESRSEIKDLGQSVQDKYSSETQRRTYRSGPGNDNRALDGTATSADPTMEHVEQTDSSDSHMNSNDRSDLQTAELQPDLVLSEQAGPISKPSQFRTLSAHDKQSKEYVSLLEKRLEVVELELNIRRKADSDLTESSDEGHTKYEDFDMNQEVRIQRICAANFRKEKSRLGVIKGAVLLQCSAFKGYGGGSKASIEGSSEPEVPYRLAINSNCLLDNLADIVSIQKPAVNTHIRPFKALIHYQEQILEKFLELEDKLALAEADAKTLARGSVTSISSNNSRPGHVATNEVSNDRIEPAKQEGSAISYHNDVRTIDDAPSHSPTKPKDSRDFATIKAGDVSCDKNSPLEKARRSRDHFRLLLDFMDHEMSDIWTFRKAIDEASIDEIAFEDLWHLYRPGQLVFTSSGRQDGRRRAYRVLHVTGGRSMTGIGGKTWQDPNVRDSSTAESIKVDSDLFTHISTEEDRNTSASLGVSMKLSPVLIDCCYIDWDGKYYGPKSIRFIVTEYPGKRSIRSLDVFPAHFDPELKITMDTLLARGAKYHRCSTVKQQKYAGRNLPDPVCGADSVDIRCMCVMDQGHLILDMKFGDRWIASPSLYDIRENADTASGFPPGFSDMFPDDEIDVQARQEFMESSEGRTLMALTRTPTEQHLILLPLRMYGYALMDRKWHALNINDVQENDEPKTDPVDIPARSFDDLVLPGSHKTLIQALVKNQMRDDTVFEKGTGASQSSSAPGPHYSLDLIRGKGRGLIILLHGPPGTGKTSTAEGLAETLGRPLFPITCGDLGTDPVTVERKLEDFFSLAQKWKCVLLLDEADVFLTRRTTGDFVRNGLVSVFLRVLEYYAGVLILTTNRVGEFDEAFRSRIHVSLYYPRLDKKSTTQIWDMNLRRIRESAHLDMDVEEDKIRAFRDKHWMQTEDAPGRRWNGRQIKNAFQTAIALANWDFHDQNGDQQGRLQRPTLTAKHFEYVADTSTEFDEYLDEVYQATAEGAYSEMAHIDRLRKDTPRPVRAAALRESASAYPRTPQSRPRTASAQSAGAIDDDKALRIKQLKRQLERLDKMKMSDEKREEKKFEYMCELDELCEGEDIFGDAVSSIETAGQEKAPWA